MKVRIRNARSPDGGRPAPAIRGHRFNTVHHGMHAEPRITGAGRPTSGLQAPARPLTGRTVLLALLAFFGVVIGVNGVMIALAIGTMPGLENEKPYQAGIAYNAEIEAARAQAARHWSVASHVTRDALGHATVTVNAHDANGVPIGGLTVAARLMRPADQRGDRTIAFGERAPGIYEGGATDVGAGAWDVEIEAARGTERLFRSHNRIFIE